MTRSPVKSSAIRSVGHDGNVLEVEMANGAIYQATGVSAEEHADFITSESLGKHFQQRLKGAYTFTKVARDPHE